MSYMDIYSGYVTYIIVEAVVYTGLCKLHALLVTMFK
jgi:hypothetical protein